MASVVFDCELDSETLLALKDLRMMRRQVLIRQVSDIDATLKHLVNDGVILLSEQDNYREKVLMEINGKLDLIEQRMDSPDTVYSDELEMYLDLLSGS